MNRKALVFVMSCFALTTSQLVAALGLPPKVREFLQTQHVIDDSYDSIPITPDGQLFRSYIADNWKAVLSDFPSIAPEPREQLLIFSALEDLPGRTYLKALNQLCDLQKHNVITTELLEHAITGPRGNLLSNNYQDPEVIGVVQRFQSQLPKNSKVQQQLTDILSGKERSIDIEGAEETGNPPPERLPSP
jgi:hypothetical protein